MSVPKSLLMIFALQCMYTAVTGETMRRELAAIMPEEDSFVEEAKRVDAKGSTWRVVLGGTRDCNNGGTRYRPSWNKQTRCKMVGGAEVCEQCSGTVDCFHGVGSKCDGSVDQSFLEVVSDSGIYTRFISRAIFCSGGKGKVSLKIPEGWNVDDGDLEMYLDGEYVCGSKKCQKEWKNLVKKEGGYELVTVFRPHKQGAKARTKKEFYFEFDSSNIPCQETSCANKLASDAALRDFNSKRLQCLQTGVGGASCAQWTSCLGADGIARSIALLTASRPTSAPSSSPASAPTSAASSATTSAATSAPTSAPTPAPARRRRRNDRRRRRRRKGSRRRGSSMLESALVPTLVQGPPDGECIPNKASDPLTCFDPGEEAFDCEDCFSELKKSCAQRCEDSQLDVCITAHLCKKANVCGSWKACYCGGEENTCMTSLGSFSQEDDADLGASLNQRASQNRSQVGKHIANKDGVDGAMKGKCAI